MKQHQKKYNLTKTKIVSKTKKNHTKIRLIAPRYKMTPRQTKSYQDKNFVQDGEKSYQDSRDHHKVMTSSITWPHVRIISLKVIKSLQGNESHTNTQKLDQDIKFTPRRTWQKEWRRHDRTATLTVVMGSVKGPPHRRKSINGWPQG